ncbi:hypothetical protein ABXN37_02825 [Piscinibacter sakaiensis]|uniref:hypothetical protein n=1 Tax=Piscinibacter sakaiensis TaxID=1547922 RepID=UPI001E33333E|nr:hypothetical protein [Piscinibacter sakaiensis]
MLIDTAWLTLPALLLPAALLALPLAWLWRRVWRPARARTWRGTWLRSTAGLCIQHVVAARFFQAIVYDLEKALADGYVLAYEGVADSNREADVCFRTALTHGKDLRDNYRELGKTCGLTYQIDWLGPVVADAKAHPERHVTMDVNTRAMKQEYDRLMQSDPAFAEAMRKRDAVQAAEDDGDGADIVTRLIDWQKAGGEGQRTLAGTLCRSIMTDVMRKSGEGVGGDMDAMVLDFRNRHLATQLLTDPRPKIYVTYGAAHLTGVMALMQREPGWKVGPPCRRCQTVRA